MSESMVTIPLKEYEELKQIKETLKTKNFVVWKDHYQHDYKVYSETEGLKILLERLEYANQYIGRMQDKMQLCRDGKLQPKDLY